MSTLPERIREAAEVLDEARAERHRRRKDESSWPAGDFAVMDMRRFADEWEAADRLAAEEAAKALAPIQEFFERQYAVPYPRDVAKALLKEFNVTPKES